MRVSSSISREHQQQQLLPSQRRSRHKVVRKACFFLRINEPISFALVLVFEYLYRPVRDLSEASGAGIRVVDAC